jgi:hypothetical protein
MRVGNAEFQGADGRRHDGAFDLDQRESRQVPVLDSVGEPLVSVASPVERMSRLFLVEHQRPQADQLRGISTCGWADSNLGWDAHGVMVP